MPAELNRRLSSRNQNDQRVIARRMAAVRHEMAGCEVYDYVLVNRDLDVTLEALDRIHRAERLRPSATGLRLRLTHSRYPLGVSPSASSPA
jgi:guanylate kinase